MKYQTVYGVTMPVVKYSINWGCGCCTKDIEIAANSIVDGSTVALPQECPQCYTGPYGNVWD